MTVFAGYIGRNSVVHPAVLDGGGGMNEREIIQAYHISHLRQMICMIYSHVMI